jgi:hypothetical protein
MGNPEILHLGKNSAQDEVAGWGRQQAHPVKTFTTRVVTAAAIVFVAGMGWFGLKKYKDAHTADSKQPIDGSITRGVYTNNFFEFTVQFPAGWKVLSSGDGPRASAKAISYVLLLVGSPDSQMHGTRWITISATQPLAPSAPLSGSPDAILKREADALKAVTAMAPSIGNKLRLTGEPSEISIAGKRMARLDTAGQVDVQGKDYDYVTAQLAIIERGYLVLFLFSDPKGQESDREAARKAIDSLHFFGKTN